MEVKIESPENGRKEIIVHINVTELTPKFEKAYQDYKKNIVLGGFRKGKVPLSLIKQMFGKAIRQDVADKQISEYSEQVINENKIRIVAPANVDDVSFDEIEGLKFKMNVEVQPDFELTKIRDFKFEKIKYILDDETLNNALENIRDKHAVMQPVEGEAKENDYVIADLQQIDRTGVVIVGKKYDEAFFHIDSNNDENYYLTRQFLGARAGDVRRVAVNEQKSGETEEYFEATIKDIKTKILPDLDDEFAKDLGDYETLEEFTNTIKARMVRRIKHESLQLFRNQVSDEIVKSNPFEISEKLVQIQLDLFIKSVKKQRPDQHFNEQILRDQYRAETIWGLRWDMLKEKIIEQENLKLTDNDYEVYYAELAEFEDTDINRIRNRYLNEEVRKQIDSAVMEQKIINFVLENSKVKEQTLPYSDLVNNGKER